MFFAGLFAMYFTARAQAGGKWPPAADRAKTSTKAVPVTLVLIASSFTCQMGVFAAERGDVFGLRPLVCDHLPDGPVLRPRAGLRVLSTCRRTAPPSPGSGLRQPCSIWPPASTAYTSRADWSPSSSLLARTAMTKFTPAQATASIVVSYYWHFRRQSCGSRLFTVIYFHPMSRRWMNRSARLKKLGSTRSGGNKPRGKHGERAPRRRLPPPIVRRPAAAGSRLTVAGGLAAVLTPTPAGRRCRRIVVGAAAHRQAAVSTTSCVSCQRRQPAGCGRPRAGA